MNNFPVGGEIKAMYDKAIKAIYHIIYISYLGEISLTVADQETGLSAAAVADYYDLLGVCGCVCDVRPRRFSTRRRAHDCADCAFAGPRVTPFFARRPSLNTIIVLLARRLAAVLGIAILVVSHAGAPWQVISCKVLFFFFLTRMYMLANCPIKSRNPL